MESNTPTADPGIRIEAERSLTPRTLTCILIGYSEVAGVFDEMPMTRVIRASHAIDAIGHLAECSASPDTRCVIVFGETHRSFEGLEDFLEGARLVDPSVRVYAVGTELLAAAGLDGWLPRGASSQDLAVFLGHGKPEGSSGDSGEPTPVRYATTPGGDARRGRSDGFAQTASESLDTPMHRDPKHNPTEHEAETPQTSPSTGVGEHAVWGDDPLLDAIEAGDALLSVAMDLIRRRLQRHDLTFAPVEEPRANWSRSAEVRFGGRVLGQLGTPSQSASFGTGVLEEQAAWLGKWLGLEQRIARLVEAADRDPLTNAWNRRYFDRYIAEAIDDARSKRHTVTVLLFDIDDFKRYNDRYGHAAGDEILIETVRMMDSVIRPTDRVCRIGGDEFVVIFYEPEGPRTVASRPPESIASIARRFQEQVNQSRFPKLGNEAKEALTISGGMATYPWDGQDAASLLRRADELALESKQRGKGHIRLGPGAERECTGEH